MVLAPTPELGGVGQQRVALLEPTAEESGPLAAPRRPRHVGNEAVITTRVGRLSELK
jgi:hypothetical protein